MKKFLKVFLIIFFICCVLFIVFLIRNYMILNNIYKLQNENFLKIENSNNFLYEQVSTNNIMDDVKLQIYYKDGVYKSITYLKNEVDNIDYLNTNEQTEITENSFIDNIKVTVFALLDKDVKNYIIKNSICHFIKSTDTQYIIPVSKMGADMDYYYVNKKNGIIEKWETDNATFTYKITENVVTDTDIEKT